MRENLFYLNKTLLLFFASIYKVNEVPIKIFISATNFTVACLKMLVVDKYQFYKSKVNLNYI